MDAESSYNSGDSTDQADTADKVDMKGDIYECKGQLN